MVHGVCIIGRCAGAASRPSKIDRHVEINCCQIAAIFYVRMA